MSGYAPRPTDAADDDTPMLPKPFTSRQLADFLHRIVRLSEGRAP